MSTEELREFVRWLMDELERAAQYTDARTRRESVLFGALFGMAMRMGAKFEAGTLRPPK